MLLSIDVVSESSKFKSCAEFLLDSGSSINLTNDKLLLKQFRPLPKPRFVRCASGKRLEILGIGFIAGIG